MYQYGYGFPPQQPPPYSGVVYVPMPEEYLGKKGKRKNMDPLRQMIRTQKMMDELAEMKERKKKEEKDKEKKPVNPLTDKKYSVLGVACFFMATFPVLGPLYVKLVKTLWAGIF